MPKGPTIAPDLASYEASWERGFLPKEDPVSSLPAEYEPWDEVAGELPKFLAAGAVRRALDGLPAVDPSLLFVAKTPKERAPAERAMVLLSYFGHAYVWGESQPAPRIPASIAVPWHAVVRYLRRPPVLSYYASYALHNWRRLEPGGPVTLGNLALLQNFLGGVDEEWFILVHVDTEAKAGPGLAALAGAQRGVAAGDAEAVRASLERIAATLSAIHAVLSRMPQKCDPYIYYQRVRPYIHGWKDHPALPDGLVNEGVAKYGGTPRQFRGETGAQSSIIPALDAGLGVRHGPSPLTVYLEEMRGYMPPKHRAFLDALERGPDVRAFVRDANAELRGAYNRCLEAVHRFRGLHLQYAADYIQKQHERHEANPAAVGTGGTPFMQYLEEHWRTTSRHLL
jgi:indoleamine 2,3-dioxygenase